IPEQQGGRVRPACSQPRTPLEIVAAGIRRGGRASLVPADEAPRQAGRIQRLEILAQARIQVGNIRAYEYHHAVLSQALWRFFFFSTIHFGMRNSTRRRYSTT